MPNIFDVALAASVSHQTVSRVLNHDMTVSPARRKRVQESIERLQYRPNAAARALASRKTRIIGLMSGGSVFLGPSSTIYGFNRAARDAGYEVLTADLDGADEERMQQAADSLLGQDVRALVMVARGSDLIEAVQSRRVDVPLVTTDSYARAGVHVVSVDQYMGATRATRHLAELGHRSIVHVAGPPSWWVSKERERGWREELARLGLPAGDVLHGDWTSASGYEIGQKLARSRTFTAVFAGNDHMALGLFHAFAKAGLRVPDDISIVGFDDIPDAAHLIPPLTTVRQDFVGLGRQVMTTVKALLEGKDDIAIPALQPRLIVRVSTAPRNDG